MQLRIFVFRFGGHVCGSLIYIPRIGIVGSCGKSLFNYLRNCQIAPFYIPSVSVHTFQLSTLHKHLFSVLTIATLMCEVISHCVFDIHFPSD